MLLTMSYNVVLCGGSADYGLDFCSPFYTLKEGLK